MRNQFPQRLTPPDMPGALFKRGVVLRRRSPEETGKDRPHLELIRQLTCLFPDCGTTPCEAAHVRFSSAAFAKAGGMGKKPADEWSAPLCAQHHRLAKDAQHNRGERAFWNELGINVLIVCQALYAKSGDLPAMRAIVCCAIAERESSSQISQGRA